MFGFPSRFSVTSQFRRSNVMTSAFFAQSQLRMRMSRRRLLQNRRMMQVRRPRLAVTSEMEGFGMDDGMEGRLKKRSAIYIPGKYKNKPLMPMDPRGSAIGEPSMNTNLKMPSSFMPSTLPPLLNMSQELPLNVMAPPEAACPSVPISEGYQNTFHVNGRSDIHQWVYIPVKIIYQRPPTYSHYSSYPIVNGEPEEEDIYSPNPHVSMKNLLQMGKPASYSKCAVQNSGAGKVYISSQGMNYMGTYKEYAVVDHRLAISVATAYVAVKSPERGATEVFLNAYDSCGRICQPYCKISNKSGFQRCSGAFRVTSQTPKLYGASYGETVTSLWQLSNTDNCPTMQDSKVYIQFHCSFRDTWPFGMPTQGTIRASEQLRPRKMSSASDEMEEPEVPEREAHLSSAAMEMQSMSLLFNRPIFGFTCF